MGNGIREHGIYLSGDFGNKIPVEYLDRVQGSIYEVELHLHDNSVLLVTATMGGLSVKEAPAPKDQGISELEWAEAAINAYVVRDEYLEIPNGGMGAKLIGEAIILYRDGDRTDELYRRLKGAR